MNDPRRDADTPKQERWTDPDSGLVVAHPYERSPYSGAGNCWCGRPENSWLHDYGQREGVR